MKQPLNFKTLEKYMKAYNISQSDLAKELGISRQTVNGWTVGYRIKPKYYKPIENYFKKRYKAIIKLEESEKTNDNRREEY